MIVYKYVPAPLIIETGRFRFSQFPALNDPFESKPIMDGFKHSIREYVQNQPEFIFNTSKMIPFERNTKLELITNPSIKEISKSLESDYLILCLTKSRNNLLMWSHYTNSHRGLVLGFETDNHFFRNNPNLITDLMEVRYSETRPQFYSNYEDFLNGNCGLENLKSVLLTKSVHWAYEEELRMFANPQAGIDIYKRDDNKIPIYLFDFPVESLREVIFGHNMLNGKKNEISKIALSKFPNVQLFEAKINQREFDLDINLYKPR